MNDLDIIDVTSVGFLNDTSMHDSIARLGQSTLTSGVSAAATAALVRLTCQAHGIQVDQGRACMVSHLKELHSLRLIYWPGGSEVKLV